MHDMYTHGIIGFDKLELSDTKCFFKSLDAIEKSLSSKWIGNIW